MATTHQSSSIEVIIRFSSSEPDQNIAIHNAQQTSGLNLKQRIRTGLSDATNKNRLRLIHAGKVIADQEALSKSLGTLLTPRRSHAKSEKARGKLPVQDEKIRVYIHCSIGDELSPNELEDEKIGALEADAILLSEKSLKIDTTSQKQQAELVTNDTSTTPAPQGFDRLLSAGFTPAEVATLRAQFLAIQAHTHTPDTMPTGPALQALEERWLEQPNVNTAPGNGTEDANDDGLDDMLIGSVVGFFWPVGVVFWLMREEGVWSRRRQMMVMLGFIINLMFGFLRLLR